MEQQYTLAHMDRLSTAEAFNSQYLVSLVCQPYEKNMLDAYASKVVMDGSVVQMVDKPK
jgi:hypothetical protein